MTPPLVLLFDGTCGFCTRCVRWVRDRDGSGLVNATVNQARGVADRYGLTRADVDRSVWVIDAHGRRASGAAAVNAVLAALGGGYAPLARLLTMPPLAWIEERAYYWVARHRHIWSRWWGDVPPCDRPGACA